MMRLCLPASAGGVVGVGNSGFAVVGSSGDGGSGAAGGKIRKQCCVG